MVTGDGDGDVDDGGAASTERHDVAFVVRHVRRTVAAQFLCHDAPAKLRRDWIRLVGSVRHIVVGERSALEGWVDIVVANIRNDGKTKYEYLGWKLNKKVYLYIRISDKFDFFGYKAMSVKVCR